MSNTIFPIHATAIAIDNAGIIITGSSGSGKSDLALRLMDRGARLIADDKVNISGLVDNPILSQCDHHIDAIEVSGIAVIKTRTFNNIPLKLHIALSSEYERNPSPLPIVTFGHYTVPSLKINPKELSAPIKIELAIHNLNQITNIS